jgi:hypothetical protein
VSEIAANCIVVAPEIFGCFAGNVWIAVERLQIYPQINLKCCNKKPALGIVVHHACLSSWELDQKRSWQIQLVSTKKLISYNRH